HLEEEVLDVVPDAPGAVGAEIREVLADFGGIQTGKLRQPLGGPRGRVPGDLEEAAKVNGKAGHGCIRNPPASPLSHRPDATGEVHKFTIIRHELAPLRVAVARP